MKALIADAHSIASLECVRSLGKRGVQVVVAGEEGAFSIAACSRYCARHLKYPGPSSGVDRFIHAFTGIVEAERPDVTILATDRTMLPFCRKRDIFSGLTGFMLPEEAAMRTAFDKVATLELGMRLRVPVPETVFIGTRKDISRAAARLGPPFVAKPRASYVIERGAVSDRRSPVFLRGEEDLMDFYACDEAITAYPIIQEWRPGFGVGISGVFDSGRPLALFSHRRLREEHPLGGRSSYCESVKPDEVLTRYAASLLSELEWRGPAMVEFRVGEDGAARLMEINGRLWGSLPLAVASGIDVPWIIFSGAMGEDVPQMREYAAGMRGRYLLADINRLLSVLRGKPAGWPGPYPARMRAAACFIGAFFHEATYFAWRRTDPMPGVRELMRFLLKESIGRIWKK